MKKPKQKLRSITALPGKRRKMGDAERNLEPDKLKDIAIKQYP